MFSLRPLSNGARWGPRIVIALLLASINCPAEQSWRLFIEEREITGSAMIRGAGADLEANVIAIAPLLSLRAGSIVTTATLRPRAAIPSAIAAEAVVLPTPPEPAQMQTCLRSSQSSITAAPPAGCILLPYRTPYRTCAQYRALPSIRIAQ